MNWFDIIILKVFKWKFYKKFDNPKKYYQTVLRQLNDDYQIMYLKK